jgi:hypothetical protein
MDDGKLNDLNRGHVVYSRTRNSGELSETGSCLGVFKRRKLFSASSISVGIMFITEGALTVLMSNHAHPEITRCCGTATTLRRMESELRSAQHGRGCDELDPFRSPCARLHAGATLGLVAGLYGYRITRPHSSLPQECQRRNY